MTYVDFRPEHMWPAGKPQRCTSPTYVLEALAWIDKRLTALEWCTGDIALITFRHGDEWTRKHIADRTDVSIRRFEHLAKLALAFPRISDSGWGRTIGRPLSEYRLPPIEWPPERTPWPRAPRRRMDPSDLCDDGLYMPEPLNNKCVVDVADNIAAERIALEWAVDDLAKAPTRTRGDGSFDCPQCNGILHEGHTWTDKDLARLDSLVKRLRKRLRRPRGAR